MLPSYDFPASWLASSTTGADFCSPSKHNRSQLFLDFEEAYSFSISLQNYVMNDILVNSFKGLRCCQGQRKMEADPGTVSGALSTLLLTSLPFSNSASQLAPAHILQSPPDPELNKPASQWIVSME